MGGGAAAAAVRIRASGPVLPGKGQAGTEGKPAQVLFIECQAHLGFRRGGQASPGGSLPALSSASRVGNRCNASVRAALASQK